MQSTVLSASNEGEASVWFLQEEVWPKIAAWFGNEAGAFQLLRRQGPRIVQFQGWSHFSISYFLKVRNGSCRSVSRNNRALSCTASCRCRKREVLPNLQDRRSRSRWPR